MAFLIRDRVKQLTTAGFSSTGPILLDTTPTGFRGFVAAIGGGNETIYSIENEDGSLWETGVGTITDAATDTISRDAVIASSSGTSKVSFSTGAKDVWCGLSQRLFPDIAGVGDVDKAIIVNATANGFSLTASALGTAAFANTGAGNGLNADEVDGEDAIDVRNTMLANGSILGFPQAVPTNWSLHPTYNDRLLAVKSGGSGGTTSGSWTITGFSIGNTAISLSQMAAHPHDQYANVQLGGDPPITGSNQPARRRLDGDFNDYNTIGVATGATVGRTDSQGSGSSHVHSASHDGGWRPAVVELIFCSRNNV